MFNSPPRRFSFLARFLVGLLGVFASIPYAQASDWKVGVAKTDITPAEPVRLSGYAARTTTTSEVDDPLFVRVLYLQHRESQPLVIVSLDAIGIAAWMTQSISEQIQKEFGITRSQLVLCTSHSHTTPHLDGAITNLFASPLSEEQKAASRRYSERIVAITLSTTRRAIESIRPASVCYDNDQADFAVNRRKITNNRWSDFGVVGEGPVDRRVRVIKAVDEAGQTMAVAYQYACHCTSIAHTKNRISADWAGLSAAAIERRIPGAIALPIIGAGADSNPNPRGEYEHAKQHGEALAAAVLRAIEGDDKPLPPPKRVSFAYAGLEFERPSKSKLEEWLKSTSPQERMRAEGLKAILKTKDRIPESYPAPIHFWGFGNELAWVFLGGEVVVDYQIRLERELSQFSQVWVASYVDDVFAYVASERVRREGGYEVDSSMIYYNQPGPWVSGTEDKLVKAILDLQRQDRSLEEPLPPDEALRSIQVAKGWKIESMATEPLVKDPINISFGPDGKVWVLEMGDYPYGGDRTGRLKCLVDSDDDGILDKSDVFLDSLPFASGVYAWRDGVMIACAPDVFFARDTNGDGKADEKIVVLSGFALANPQHRVHGFTYGLENKLHFGAGDGTDSVALHSVDGSQKSVDIRGGDLALDPDRHELSVETGPTQFIRSHDGWGNWFGNDNTHPIYHFLYERHWIQPGAPRPRSFDLKLTTPASSPEVFPLSQPLDRFNDPLTASRYTSVCSTMINQSPACGPGMLGSAIVCEPVHNLVSRLQLQPHGISWKANRFLEDSQSEWIRSSDPWFRPVRVVNAPDGTIWVVDMYRRVIEHPTWIPEEWLARLDVTAGKEQGRLYRVFHESEKPLKPIRMDRLAWNELVDHLGNPVFAIADLAQQQLIWKHGNQNELMTTLAKGLDHDNPQFRLRCFAILNYFNKLSTENARRALSDSDPRVASFALRQLSRKPSIANELIELIAEQVAQVKWRQNPRWSMDAFFVLVNCGVSKERACVDLLFEHASLRGFEAMVDFVANERVESMVRAILDANQPKAEVYLNRLIPRCSLQQKTDIAKSIASHQGERPAWHFQLVRQLARDSNVKSISTEQLDQIARQSRVVLENENSSLATRLAALELQLSRLTAERVEEIDLLLKLAERSENELRSRIVTGVMDLGDGVLDPVLARLPENSPALRSAIVSVMVSKPNGATRLIDAIEVGRLPAAIVEPSQLEALRGNQTPGLQKRVLAIFGANDRTNMAESIASYSASWPSTVDAASGKLLYEQHCAKCHRERLVDNERSEPIGPGLQALNHWTNEAWIVAILDPSRSVDAKYRRSLIRTSDSQVLSGLPIRDTSDSMELITTDGRFETIRKSDIEEMKPSDLSLMPDGFSKLLTPEQLAQIVTYLRRGGESTPK